MSVILIVIVQPPSPRTPVARIVFFSTRPEGHLSIILTTGAPGKTYSKLPL